MILAFPRTDVRARFGYGNFAGFGFAVNGNAPTPAAPETGFDHEQYIAISPNRLGVRFGFRPLGHVAVAAPITGSMAATDSGTDTFAGRAFAIGGAIGRYEPVNTLRRTIVRQGR